MLGALGAVYLSASAPAPQLVVVARLAVAVVARSAVAVSRPVLAPALVSVFVSALASAAELGLVALRRPEYRRWRD